jgi:hypothetical protein
VPSVKFFRFAAVNFFRSAALVSVGLGIVAISRPAQAQVNIAPQALEQYAYCIEQATQNNSVFPGAYIIPTERGITYRCRDEVAVAYFNDLGRRRRRATDSFAHNETGAYVLRPIWGIGFCWHKIEDALGFPVSFWGCDVFIAY